ncbi:MAG: DUF368 domain-containing protein [Pseudohongiellaceae bacterium]
MSDKPDEQNRLQPLACAGLFLKGMAMGAADAVPGVSGGTVAVMMHIYERLLGAIRAAVPAFHSLWCGHGVASAWRTLDGTFLVTLVAGILASLLLVANLVLYLLDTLYPLVMALFCGLVLASARFLLREVERWSAASIISCLLGGAGTVLLSLGSPVSVEGPSAAYLFLCGAVAICAMILPGLSGAFLLLLLGVYEPVLSALRAFEWGTILVFAAGCVTGLLSFAHVLGWVFLRYRSQTYAAIIGMLMASLVALWPWKNTALSGGGISLLGPGEYEAITGQPAHPLLVLGLVVAGFSLILLLERVTGRAVR